MQQQTGRHLKSEGTYLFSHWFRVGDSGTEVPIPLQPAVQARPVVVSVASVRQAPRNEGPKLLVLRVTGLSLCTRTHTSQSFVVSSAILLVMVGVLAAIRCWIGGLQFTSYNHNSQLLSKRPIREVDLNVGQVPPVGTRSERNVTHSGCHQWIHLLANVVIENWLVLAASQLQIAKQK